MSHSRNIGTMSHSCNIIPDHRAAALRFLLADGWTAETSSAENWTSERPETGQCAVTALVVQDVLGGELHRALVNGESHYWNVLEDGTVIDLTRSQFDEPLVIEDETVRQREYVLSFPVTAHRYQLLRWRIARALDAYALVSA